MSEFSADWLALREPVDHAARSRLLAETVAGRLRHGAPVRVLDLATGTGANLRYLAPLLPSPQDWCVVDRDTGLLARLPQRVGAWAISAGHIVTGEADAFTLRSEAFRCRVVMRSADLARLASARPASTEGMFDGVTLVTASALLDLVSERWLTALAARCRLAGASVLFGLSYDGRIACTPAEPDDEMVRDLVNCHQHSTKGFGRALGPEATACALRCFRANGYEAKTARSDWVLAPAQQELQRQLIGGWAGAATEMDPACADRVAAWRVRRLDHVRSGRSAIVVGHEDFAAWPAE